MNIGKKGFTLIELLVVVLIIGILAAIALPQYQVAVEKARIQQYLTTARAIFNAQDMYYLQTDAYAYSMELLDILPPQGFSVCRSLPLDTTYYTNGKWQFAVTKYGDVLAGAVTYASGCAGHSAKSSISFYRTGGAGKGICPNTKQYCIICASDNSVGGKACASLGTYLPTNDGLKTYILN
jgi:prepilin-type N-terminal cleavage/methylation domain-containing protein